MKPPPFPVVIFESIPPIDCKVFQSLNMMELNFNPGSMKDRLLLNLKGKLWFICSAKSCLSQQQGHNYGCLSRQCLDKGSLEKNNAT